MTWLQAAITVAFALLGVLFALAAGRHAHHVVSGVVYAVCAVVCMLLCMLVSVGGVGFPPAHF